MRRGTIVSCFIMLALMVGACVSGPQQTNNTGARKKKGPNDPVVIGFRWTPERERWQRDKDLVRSARKIGSRLMYKCHGSDSEQIKQPKHLTQGVDVLIVGPQRRDCRFYCRSGAPAGCAGHSLRSLDQELRCGPVHLASGSQMGEMQAQYLLDHVNKKPANFVIVGGSPTDNNAILLHQGQMNVLKPAVDRGDVKIVTDQYAKEWQASEALNIVENALTRTNNQVDAVVCSNDGTARGAVQALEGQKLAGKVLVSGQDADLASLKLIVEGKQTMTIYKSIQPLAYGAVDAAYQLARVKRLKPQRLSTTASRRFRHSLTAGRR